MCSEGPRGGAGALRTMWEGPSHDVCDRKNGRPALRGTPLIKVSMSCPWPSVTFNSTIGLGRSACALTTLRQSAAIRFSSMRILFALHSHRIGTKVPLTLKRLLHLATLDGAVDLGIADPDPGPVA